MRLNSLLPVVALAMVPTLATAQDNALQSADPSSVTFGWENIMATGTEFTAEAWVRANPNCLSGDFDIFSRLDLGTACTEAKYLRLSADGTVSALYHGSVDVEVSSAAGAFPVDEDWHHVAFVHRADNSYAAYVDAVEVLSGVGNGYPVGFLAGLDTTVAAGGDGWQVSELAVSDVSRYGMAGFLLDESLGGDTNYILLMHFENAVDHDNAGGFPRVMTGTLNGAAVWTDGMHGDMDSDGVSDDSELAACTSVFDQDSDDDGLSDADEAGLGTDPCNVDTDGDCLQDGTEVSETVGDAGDAILCVLGTDMAVFVPDADDSDSTDPLDMDSDDDGLTDGEEDANCNGKWQRSTEGETDATNPDSDGDCIQDGTEQSMVTPTEPAHTDLAVFVPDADPTTATDPLDEDTDGGGLSDGREDVNCNGAIDKWEECDPLDSVDDCWTLETRQNTWFPGGPAYFDGFGLVPNDASWNGESFVVMCYTFDGYGSTYLSFLDMSLVLDGAINRFPDDYYASGEAGHVAPSHNALMTIRVNIPNSIPPGVYIFFQGVEVVNDFNDGSTRYRMSNAVDRQVQ